MPSNVDWWNKIIKDSTVEANGAEETEGDFGEVTSVLPLHNGLVDNILADTTQALHELKESDFDKLTKEGESDAVKSWKPIDFTEEGTRPLDDREKKRIEETLKRLHAYGDSLGKLEEKKTITVDEPAPAATASAGKKGGAPASAAGEAKVNPKVELMKLGNLVTRSGKDIDTCALRF